MDSLAIWYETDKKLSYTRFTLQVWTVITGLGLQSKLFYWFCFTKIFILLVLLYIFVSKGCVLELRGFEPAGKVGPFLIVAKD